MGVDINGGGYVELGRKQEVTLDLDGKITCTDIESFFHVFSLREPNETETYSSVPLGKRRGL